MRILDIHTHHTAPQPEAIVAICVHKEFAMPEFEPGQAYSIGIHPWDTVEDTSALEWTVLEELAARPDVLAIGESGIDLTPKGGPMFRQLQVFKRQVELSEKLAKPLVVHDVKAHDIIIGARRDLKPKQNWAIHGFRNKKEVAEMLLRAGCYISFGIEFNHDALLAMPADRILAETDESKHSIEDVIAHISNVRGEDMTFIIAENTLRFLNQL